MCGRVVHACLLQVLHGEALARGDASLMIVAFHRLADALAWAMRTHHSLLHATWPEALACAEAARTIHHRSPDGRWGKLFAGLRVATAVNKQMLSSAARVVRPRHPPIFCASGALQQVGNLSSAARVVRSHCVPCSLVALCAAELRAWPLRGFSSPEHAQEHPR